MPQDENQRVLEALQRLGASLKALPQTKAPPKLSHWRNDVPEALTTALNMMEQGRELVHATCTKFTLVTKLDPVEGSKLAKDLLQGCELVGTASYVVHDDAVGVSVALRKYLNHAVRSVVATCIALLEVFSTGNNLSQAAPKTGAIWDACDKVAKLPKNNRNAIRRAFMTYKMECQDTLNEFTELLLSGDEDNAIATVDDSTSWEVFCSSRAPSSDYSTDEHDIAVSGLTLIKCSRGSLQVALQASDAVGDADLDWVARLVKASRTVGEGMTDVGTLLYAPLELEELREEVTNQSDAIDALHKLVLEEAPVEIPAETLTLSTNIRAACRKRATEALERIDQQL